MPPHGNTKFNVDWLQTLDISNQKMEKWCVRGSDIFSFRCNYCNPKNALLQHAKGDKHMNNSCSRKNQCTISVASFKKVNDEEPSTSKASNDPSSASQQQITYKIPGVNTVSADIIWMLTVADKNFSYKSCDGLTETWKHMFYDSEIACNMSLSHGKASYIMSDGIGPVLLSEFISDVQQSGLFTLHFDEATRMDGHEQCDILVRYWSKNADKVVVSFYKAIELGHATGDIVSTEILNALDNDGLSLRNLLMLSNDGPNVNKTIHRLINDAVVNLRDKALLNIGTCTLHITHNAFGAGISEYGKNTQELAMNLHAFFHASAARKEELQNMQALLNIDEYVFLQYVPSRWLTLANV